MIRILPDVHICNNLIASLLYNMFLYRWFESSSDTRLQRFKDSKFTLYLIFTSNLLYGWRKLFDSALMQKIVIILDWYFRSTN